MSYYNKPLAGRGIRRYRYEGTFGYIMIGDKSHAGALSEAKRSLASGRPTIDKLQVWGNGRYVRVSQRGRA